jgi:hydroxyacylglutathione hydrolase
MIIETVEVGGIQTNCYIVASREGGQAIIIDPGAQERKIRQALDAHGLAAALVVNTHGHYDHIGADAAFGVPVRIHAADANCLTDPQANLSGYFSAPQKVDAQIGILQEGDRISVDGVELEVLHIPGHTAGGIALRMRQPRQDVVFSGDSLFAQGIGRTDLPGGDEQQLVEAITKKLFSLPDDTVVYPGHGPATTIGEEKQGNPYLG